MAKPRIYQAEGAWWYKRKSDLTGEVRPFGPFRSREEAELRLEADLDSPHPQTFIREMSEESITCRDLSHTWRPFSARRIEGGGYERTVRCATCGSDRVELLDRWGQLVRRHYDYADGYLVPGMGRMDSEFRAHVRLTSLLRTLKDPS